jgi:hypothetical protein
VHAALTALAPAANPAWADYETLLLDPAAVYFFDAACLPGAKAMLLKKKRARDAASGADVSDEDDDGAVCEHCGGPVPQISLRVASLGGTTLAVAVAQRGLVREAKRLIGQVGSQSSESTEPPDCIVLLCAVVRHGPGPERALRRRQGGQPV